MRSGSGALSTWGTNLSSEAMLLVDDLAAGGTKNLRHTPRGLVTLVKS